MKYMLLVYSPEDAWTQEEWTACTVESMAVCHELQSKGQLIVASPLHPVSTAASVRVRNGQPIVTAGPFAETTEQLGGFFLIDVPNLDDAISIAKRLPSAKKGTIEVRPVFRLEGFPSDKFPIAPTGSKRVGSERVGSERSGSRYMLLCYDNQEAWNELGPVALSAAQAEAVALTLELDLRGQYMSASPLHSVSTATSVRIREGKPLITAGPFAETNEFLGGYYIILAHDLNDAIHIASKHPGANLGTVEVRKLFELPMS
jgi:hypothetical protein